jgi:homoserine kinase type II
VAVYTEVGRDDAAALARRLGLGAMERLQGIPAGIENTNYFLDAGGRRFVLTLFERLLPEQLPYYLGLMKHLAGRGIPVPDPQAGPDGVLLHQVVGKPAAVLTRLPGEHREAPDLHHCEQVGATLACLHEAGQDYAPAQEHLRGLRWWEETLPVLLPHLDADLAALVQDELAFQQAVARSRDGLALPRGAIHADLFRDNVLFEGPVDDLGHDRLTGFLDFFFAGTDSFLFDIAVCLNDWCTDLDTGRLVEARAEHFVGAYERVRPLTAAEVRLMPALLRAAAFRFWLSRAWDLQLPRDAQLLAPKDPGQFERVLRERRATPWHPPR